MRCWPSRVAVLALAALLGGCGASAQRSTLVPATAAASSAAGPAPCDQFVDAWVEHFRANVAKLDGQAQAVSQQGLLQARQALNQAAVTEARCELPFCVVQPLAGGRLDSYCGYRRDDPSGAELYLWQPWQPMRR